jgi:polar amino acid transport system substrate-binding protein
VKVRRPSAVVVLATAAAIVLAGCANNQASENTGTPGGSSGSAAPFDPSSVAKDDALAGQVDSKISSDGKLVVGTDPSYEPSEIKDSSGKIVGFDVDLGTAIAKKLGLTAEFQQSKFEAILPALGTRYEIGMSSFTDNPDREKVVDFVTYYRAGTQWAAKDAAFDPENACGKKVAVQTGTVQATEDLPVRIKKCTDGGKPTIAVQKYDDQTEATNAVVLGKADAVLADSPVMAYAVKKVGGGLSLVGDVYDAAPYGIAIPKNAGTTKAAILGAVKALIADGSYKKILDKWGVGSGAITDPVVNGAAK